MIAAVRRLGGKRDDFEAFMETRFATPRLAAFLLGASARQLPAARYEDVLSDALERITDVYDSVSARK